MRKRSREKRKWGKTRMKENGRGEEGKERQTK